MKRVYTSFFLHGNMCYDRYTKQEIRAKFPLIYANGIRAMAKFPEVTAHIDFPGLTLLSLKHHAPWLLEELQPLIDRGQVIMVGCQYAASHAMCADEESDLVADRVTMEMIRDELKPEIAAFFPQESPFHPQHPYIMGEIGAVRLIEMPEGWARPRRVQGINGSEVIVYPASSATVRLNKLEEYYDTHQDGDFVMTGGDFEMLGRVEEFVANMQELAERGKIIEWTTMERYEREIGVPGIQKAPTPGGHAPEEREPSPSFSRWVSDPEDMVWHGQAVHTLDAVRTAGFAKVAAELHGLGTVDAPLSQAWTTEPDNVWDHHFEHVLEYPETEAKYLTVDGTSTLLSRAWHHLLIGLNSDASGWVPWAPRTRHRQIALQTSRALAQELLWRFAGRVAAKIAPPTSQADGYLLALNAAPARTVEVNVETSAPQRFVGADGTPIPTATRLENGKWSATARVALPAYGYRMLGLQASDLVETARWREGAAVRFAGKQASLSDGALLVQEGDQQVQVTFSPFALSDPAGMAEAEVLAPTWALAKTRVRQTMLGADLEVLDELAWAVWMRLVIGLREERVDVSVEVYVDAPRRIGKIRFDPQGILLAFRGQPGAAFYDIPYAVIRHPYDAASFVAAQRFAAIEGQEMSFGLVALAGNQSFQVVGQEGVVAAALGASKQARPARRPECNIRLDGTAQHVVIPDADALLDRYDHRFVLVFADRTGVALAARRLRTGVPLLEVSPSGEEWPPQRTLLAMGPDTAHVTAFRTTRLGPEIVANDMSGEPSTVWCEGASSDLVGYGVAKLRLSRR
ncbi:MAG: hypothetical protein GXY76_09595 [Chloroflexi bacterium]|nr:hypothetical protein [Chloroflexota bacterium]